MLILRRDYSDLKAHLESNYHPEENYLKISTDIVKTPTQRQLNNNSTKVGFDMKMTLNTTPPHPTTQTQCQ